MAKENEYREIFLAEALESHEAVNKFLTQLEKDPSDKKSVHAIFRIVHTLKGNASGMGFTKIAELAHALEDLFGGVRDGRIALSPEVINAVFRAVDILGELINAINTGKEVRYLGIKTKLSVLAKRSDDEVSAGDIEKERASKADLEKQLVQKQILSQEEVADLSSAQELAQALEEEEDEDVTESKIVFSDLVQVPVRKLDNLLNLVGELIIEKDRIMALQNGNRNDYNRLNRISSDLQYSMMDVRLVQVGFLFNKFYRVVRDAAALENKLVSLDLKGTDTEIDRNVLQVVSDSLIHIIRNCVGHGIESPEERAKAGKPKEGTISLSAVSDSDAVVIVIKDDGAGINLNKVREKAIEKGVIKKEDALALTEAEIIMLIFEPGFSTMEQVTAIAGRGVGMDVVKRALDSIGGNIEVDTRAGAGTTFTLTLPSSMAVKSTLLFELSHQHYAIPLSFTESVVSMYRSQIHYVGEGLVAEHQGRHMTIVFLKDLFDSQKEECSDEEKILQRGLKDVHPEKKLDIVVVSHNNRLVGFVVDKLFQQKEIVEKPLVKPVEKTTFISGVTILGDGRVCLVLNVVTLVNYVFNLTVKSRNIKV